VSLFGLFLVFGAINAPVSWMDDRAHCHVVTEFLAEFPSTARPADYFVTRNRPVLSASIVWTGFALHG
jgi:hypothetical protein